ncbi:bifunctional molybdopterin-guanine dinucleotide biosynthesis adaptor protein MobB/molybdopterin molybdotransferase MoeA [Neptunomonas phycophila]|uniref:bifunctional molybdopterin-guanine dinucleotide biosynthesis adaptor protein MobB/molybdopterin molybdotransferase MoeA n=1 Tax=Neptunomonas phycophila TaxID=1572645 RepID=UPI0026E3E782|nr:bifunctional molybdopterin-guanine dinucleotide biosynthesis adaptor protein MobB/molybdopterin molybdotransferase MoeA [Neptunomonas phycophila]MDO6785801.1 bifunctional molybdopterin-guanine dinucleotide biosynthesis adaptor protein MobB/molybdopterin molybdotransferase MoeA [Neptunomonas phycophila]
MTKQAEATSVVSCFDAAANPGGMLSVSESVQFLLDAVLTPKQRALTVIESLTETIPLTTALKRVLAEDIASSINVPPTTNSAMDGYALGYSESLDLPLRVIGEAYAGHGYEGVVHPGEAVKIMTGAPLPTGCDTVIIKEAAQVKNNLQNAQEPFLYFQGAMDKGQHVRQAGEDLQQGQLALAHGTLLRPQEIGLLASIGHDKVMVYSRLRVAIFSTGDEVHPQGKPLPSQGIYDTNRFSLRGLLEQLGCEVVDLGIIADDKQSLSLALAEGAAQADCIISSGGVSMGDADYIREVLASAGHVDFWRIAMRPGRPFAFGHVNDRPFFGLPGNPVAVMVTFLQFVQPALRKMMGQERWQPIRLTAVAEEPLRSRKGRTDYSRGIYRINEQGVLVVKVAGSQGSGILTSMVAANCLIEITDDDERIEAGQSVTIQPFSDLL